MILWMVDVVRLRSLVLPEAGSVKLLSCDFTTKLKITVQVLVEIRLCCCICGQILSLATILCTIQSSSSTFSLSSRRQINVKMLSIGCQVWHNFCGESRWVWHEGRKQPLELSSATGGRIRPAAARHHVCCGWQMWNLRNKRSTQPLCYKTSTLQKRVIGGNRKAPPAGTRLRRLGEVKTNEAGSVVPRCLWAFQQKAKFFFRERIPPVQLQQGDKCLVPSRCSTRKVLCEILLRFGWRPWGPQSQLRSLTLWLGEGQNIITLRRYLFCYIFSDTFATSRIPEGCTWSAYPVCTWRIVVPWSLKWCTHTNRLACIRHRFLKVVCPQMTRVSDKKWTRQEKKASRNTSRESKEITAEKCSLWLVGCSLTKQKDLHKGLRLGKCWTTWLMMPFAENL